MEKVSVFEDCGVVSLSKHKTITKCKKIRLLVNDGSEE